MLKSALGYLAGANSQFGASSPGGNNDLVGSTLELGNYNLRVKRVVAEGGFAVVFEAADTASNKVFAVKRLLAHDNEKKKEVEQEISFLKKLSGHPNIIRFVTAASSQNNVSGGMEYIVVMEYCPRGRLTDVLAAKSKLSRDEVISYFYQIARAVQHMHCQNPPIIHRDLKLENVLISSRGILKLCDFGSATTEEYHPDYSWTALRRSQVEDEIVCHTTPMYRTPEMLDLYQNFPIDKQQDVWALGCTLYLLSFGTHPFEDSAKLRILNANYTLENKDPQFEVLHDLIKGCLMVDPRHRPSINDVVQRVEEIAEALQINLSSLLKKSASSSPMHETQTPISTAPPPQREPVASENRPEVNHNCPPNNSSSTSDASGAMFSSFKSGAASFLSNVKETSNKMMETMSSYAKGELDISYITSRILVMSYPREGIQGAVRNNIDDVKAFLDAKHSGKYALYNLTLSTYRHEKFQNRVSDCGWPAKKSPNLNNLLIICKNMSQWLKMDAKNIAVIHCIDGKAQSALVVAAFFAFCNMYQTLGPSLHLFTLRRTGAGIIPSHRRYIEYVADVCNSSEQHSRIIPHQKVVRFTNLILRPVPLINSQRTGCKPFCEVYQNESRVFTTSQEYDAIPGFDNRDDCVMIPLEIDLSGDLTFIVYHARSLLGGKVQAKNISLKMFQFQFNSGFLPENSCSIKFGRFDLDYLETPDRYPDLFNACLNYEVTDRNSTVGHKKNFSYEFLKNKDLSPYLVVKDDSELNQIYQQVGAPEPRSHRAHENECFEFKSSGSGKKASENLGNGVPFNHVSNGLENSADNQLNQTTSSNEDHLLLVSSETDASSPSRASPVQGYINVAAAEDVPSLLDFGADEATPKVQTAAADPFAGNFDPFSNAAASTEANFNLFADDPFGSSNAKPSQQQDNTTDLFGTESLLSQFDSVGISAPPRPTTPIGPAASQKEIPNLLGDWSDVVNQPSSQPGHYNQQFSNKWNPSGNAQGQQMYNRSVSNVNANLGLNNAQSNGSTLDPFGSLDPFASQKPTTPETHRRSNTSSNGQMQQQAGFGMSAARSRSVSPNPAARHQMPTSQQQSTANHSTYHQSKPNYNLNIPPPSSASAGGNSGGSKTGIPPKQNKTDFADLLGGFNVSSTATESGGKSLKDLRNQQQAQYMDPDEVKIRDWVDGKEGNIRGLLCSLHKVVWPESPWEECGMHQLVTPSDVKKMWRKALLATHPDKQVGTANEKISKMIMIELNDAWDKYQNSGAQSLYGT